MWISIEKPLDTIGYHWCCPVTGPEIAQQEGFLSQNFSTQHRPVTSSAVQSDELKVMGMFRRPSGWAVLEKTLKFPGVGRKSDH